MTDALAPRTVDAAYHFPQQLQRLGDPFDELVPLPNHPWKLTEEHEFASESRTGAETEIFRKTADKIIEEQRRG
jgi:hypothetical protein